VAARAPYFCLSFTLTFDYADDTVFIAYSQPYKLSKIMLEIVKRENQLMDQEPDKYSEDQKKEHTKFDGSAEITIGNLFTYQRRMMCTTLSGIPMPIITITACKSTGKKMAKREAVIITSRVHPGETNSSFVFSGMFEMVTRASDPVAQYLRENFVIKMVPCLNPDGVVRGNYRSSLAGVDLNR